MRTTALALLVLLLALLTSCSGPAVRANPPAAFVPPHSEPPCPSGCIAMQGAPNFLEIRLGPLPLNTQATGFTTTLPFAMRVSHLDVWIGTQSDHIFESDSRLQVILPDGTFLGEWKAQFDKHQDVVGDLQRNFPVSLDLPAGTSLVVYSTGAGIISCPSACGWDTTWSLSAF